MTSRSDNSLLSPKLKEQLINEFVFQFQNDGMLEYFLETKGVPIFDQAWSINKNGKVNSATVPVLNDGKLVGTIHHVYGENGVLSFVDYLSIQHIKNLLGAKIESIGSNRQKYLLVTAHAQFVTASLIGQPVNEANWTALRGLDETIGASGDDTIYALEECDGEWITITTYNTYWEDVNHGGASEVPNGGTVGNVITQITAAVQLCVQTGGNQNGGGTGTTYGTTDGPQIPIGTLGSPYGPGGGESDPDGGGCTDENPSGANTNPGGHMGGDGPGGEGGAEDPGIVEARLEEGLEQLRELNELFPLEGSGPCLLFNTSLINAVALAAESYGGRVNCFGESSEDRIRTYLSGACTGGGCAQLFRENVARAFEEEEWIDYSGIEDHERLLCIFENMTQSRPCLWSEVAIPRFLGLSGIDLEFFNSNLVDRNGTTKVELNSGDPKIRIGIDTEYANSACAWEVTRTLLHEIIHAELAAYAKSKGEDYLDYAEHFEFYRNDKSLGHNAMADLYRGRIAESLKSVFGEIYTNEQYQAMAWTGLSEQTIVRLDGSTYTIAISQAWTSMSNSEKQSIRTTLSNLELNCYDPCD